jgi:hypothetical protein
MLKQAVHNALRFLPFVLLLVAIVVFRRSLFVDSKSDAERLREAISHAESSADGPARRGVIVTIGPKSQSQTDSALGHVASQNKGPAAQDGLWIDPAGVKPQAEP